MVSKRPIINNITINKGEYFDEQKQKCINFLIKKASEEEKSNDRDICSSQHRGTSKNRD